VVVVLGVVVMVVLVTPPISSRTSLAKVSAFAWIAITSPVVTQPLGTPLPLNSALVNPLVILDWAFDRSEASRARSGTFPFLPKALVRPSAYRPVSFAAVEAGVAPADACKDGVLSSARAHRARTSPPLR
jgi:hypothetical protein